jgi:aspartate aminotransferase
MWGKKLTQQTTFGVHMKFIADRLELIEPSPTLAITARAKELRASGRDIIGFGAGEPDFDTPEHIRQAAKKALDEGQTRYTAVGGTPALKKAIIEKFKRDNRLSYNMNEVTVGNGGKQVIYNVFMAALNPGDEVIIPAPYWVSYADIVRLAQGIPKIVYCPIEQNYLLKPEQLERAISPKTKAIIINSPSNPTGAMYSEKELHELGEILLKHPNILILSDDIYEHIVFDGNRFMNLAMLFPQMLDRIVVVNGVSKAYSMTGWRIGYGAGPAYLIENIETMQGQSTSNASSVSQAAAVAALSQSQDCIEEMRKAFEYRRELVYNMILSISGVKTIRPMGAFYIFPDVSAVYRYPKFIALKNQSGESSDSKFFCTHLLDHYDVAAVPGSAFGDDSAFRISYALDEKSIRTGVERIGNMINDLR